jgi:thiamine pyrophosphate-dependent acetolactate synthase large subunit-like protein
LDSNFFAGGAAATLTKGRGALQDIEQVGVLKTVCKATFAISAVRQIIPVMRKAFQKTLSGTPGQDISIEK